MSLPIYFAPLEGVTDAVYRRVHHAHFTGIDKYFIPFISPTQNLVLTPRERTNVCPESNTGMYAVPQVLTKRADHFLWAEEQLLDMGYTEININLGCPSGTVTAKGKGAGMLEHPIDLELFLDEVFSKAASRVSLKTRIGFSSPEEFEHLLELFSRYPVYELIIHPRTRQEYYKGCIHREAYAYALQHTALPLVYNGDLFTPDACRALEAAYPATSALMLGRGLLANPALAQTVQGGMPLSREALRAFHDDLYHAYHEAYPKSVVLGRMREVAKNIACCFENADKPLKAARKAASLHAYEDAVSRLFEQHELSENPHFSPDK